MIANWNVRSSNSNRFEFSSPHIWYCFPPSLWTGSNLANGRYKSRRDRCHCVEVYLRDCLENSRRMRAAWRDRSTGPHLHKRPGIALVPSPIGSGKTELRLLNLCKISLFLPLRFSAALSSLRCSSRSDASSFRFAAPRSLPRPHQALLKK